jgi:hypothetical protein
VQDPARSELLLELGIFRVVRALRLLLRVKVVKVPEELIEAVSGGQELIAVTEVILAELAGDVTQRLEECGSSDRSPRSAPGSPTLVRPVRIGDWPVMNAARPAVQLCWPYQSVNIAPSFATRSMFGV